MERRQTEQLMTETYSPFFQWTQDPLNHFLRIQLPGFKRGEITVQIDQTGKLTIKGRRLVPERGKYVLVDQVFDVPKDTSIDKITGAFDDGHLTLNMPKKVIVEKEVPQKPISSVEKKEEVDRKEAPQKAIPSDEKKKELGEKEVPQKTTPPEDKKKEREEKELPQRYPSSDEKKKQQEEKEMPEKITKPSVTKEEEKEKEEKPRRSEDGERNQIGGMMWDKVVCKWIDEERYHGMVDNLLEKINKHRTEIGVAFVAFTVGFYLSHKLRARGS